MPISTPARLLASVASLALIAATGPALAQSPSVGTAAAVNPRSTGSGTRTLELGSNIVHRERIETSSTGSVQVLFVDKTTLNIGPNSNLLIDEFVYDPNAKKGSMAISLTKGAVRFVGGNASHSDGAEVKTPVATRVPQGQIDAIIAQTRSRTGQNGGRPEPTPDVTGLDRGSSHPCSIPVQGQTTMDLAAASCRFVNTDLQGEADLIAQQAAQQNQANVLVPLVPQTPCPPYSYNCGGGGGGGYFAVAPVVPQLPQGNPGGVAGMGGFGRPRPGSNF